MREIVICSAVRYDGRVWRGHRHLHALKAMNDELSYTMTRREMNERGVDRDQGFITSLNRFVDREEGVALQLASGIKSVRKEGYSSNCLYSEDLY